jgi:hypothetical protein
MDLPELKSGEKGLIKSPGVQIKNVPFNAFLTSERVILRSIGNTGFPQKDIPLDTIESAEPGENENGEPLVTVSVLSPQGEIKRMILAFPREGGQSRKEERDRWVLKISERKVAAEAWEKDTEAKEKRAKDPNARPTFHDGIHAQTGKGDKKALRGDLRFITKEKGRAVGKDTLTFRDNGITNEDLTGKPQAQEGLPAEKEGPRAPPMPVTEEPKIAGIPLGYEEPEGRPAPQQAGWFFCNRCGNRVPPGSLFCNRCGNRVLQPEGEAPPASPPASPPAPAWPVIPAPEPDAEKYTVGPAAASQPEFDLRNFPVEPIRKEGLFPVPEPKKKKAKKSLISKFSFLKKGKKKTRQETPGSPEPEPSPTSGSQGGKRRAPSRKVIIGAVAVVIIIAVAVAGIMFGGTVLKSLPSIPFPSLPAGDNSSGTATPAPAVTATSGSEGSSPQTTVTPGSVVIPTKTPLVIPSDNVYIRVDYLGSWSGMYGTASNLIGVRNSGERMYGVENPNGTVIAGFKKLDKSAHLLTVEIYKNGQIVESGTTTAPEGVVNVTASV